MHLWIVNLCFDALSDDTFRLGLSCVDEESRIKVGRFLRKEDAWRCLVGRTLPLLLLKQRGIDPSLVKINRTDAGKPYIAAPTLTPHIGFNISHDSDMVAMAFHENELPAEARKIGVDVMKVALPRGETLRSFREMLEDQLTPAEMAFLKQVDETSTLGHIFTIWTIKEAYTKAEGLGLGFDFSRIEWDFSQEQLKVDGALAVGWEIWLAEFSPSGNDKYMVACCHWTGASEFKVTRKAHDDNAWWSRLEVLSIFSQVSSQTITLGDPS